MRLVNARFGTELKFFWDERAVSLENQSTQPIQDMLEMGFSGLNGQPDIDSLIRKLNSIAYYPTLFNACFGDASITENRLRIALSMFIRSLQSFDSKYDIGLALASGNVNAPFPNFSQQENLGKDVFMLAPPNGAGCQGCHRAPEFDIDPNSENNNIVGVAGVPGATDFSNTRSPSLRNLINPAGIPNGPFMHDGSLLTLMDVIEHYNSIIPVPGNNRLDNRLRGPNGTGQQLNLSQGRKNALLAFLRTLSGVAVYSDEQWSNPFDSAGNLNITNLNLSQTPPVSQKISISPNPAKSFTQINLPNEEFSCTLFDNKGSVMKKTIEFGSFSLSLQDLPVGIYFIQLESRKSGINTILKLAVEH